MATELGKAYVQIIPSAKGIKSNISKELSNHMKPALKSMEKNIGKSITSSLSAIGDGATKIGNTLTNKITKPALLAVSALGGLSIWKGFGRLKDMDMAQAKLRGIGIEGETLQKVLEGASDAVLGTSHTTAEAVNVASTAIASGVKAGESLNSYLKNVADAASFANVPLTDMGGIFSKVQAQGKLTGQVVQQLASHGIGIVGILAEETGKSMEQVSADISKGAVSAEMFYDAMHNYMGGAAAEIGDTFDVALKNIGSRLGILGEKFLGNWKAQEGAFYVLKDVMQDFLNYIPTLYGKAEELGKKFGDALSGIIEKIKSIKDWFTGLDEGTQNLLKKAIPGFAILAVGLGPALKGFGSLAKASSGISKIFAGLGAKAGGISPMLGGIVSAFSALGPAILGGGAIAALGLLSNAFGDQIEAMLTLAMEKGPELIQNLTAGIIEKLPKLMEAGTQMLTSFVEAINVLLPEIVLAGIEIISALIIGFADNLPAIIESVVSLIGTITLTLIESIPLLVEAGMELLKGIVHGIIDNLPLIIQSVAEIITSLLDAIMESIPLMIEAGIELFVALVEALPEIIAAIVEALPKIIESIINAIMNSIPLLIDAGIKLLVALVENLPAIISGIVNALPKIIESIISTLINNIPLIIQAGVDLLLALITNLPKIIIELVKAMPKIIWEMVKALGKGVVEFAKIGLDLIKGLWNGIKNAGAWIKDKIKGFVDGILGGIKSFFGIKSPSKVMRDEIGKWIPSGLAVGIEANTDPVSDAMEELGGLAADSFNPDLGYSANFSGDTQFKNESEGLDRLVSAVEALLDRDVVVEINGKEIARQTADDIGIELHKRKEAVKRGRKAVYAY